MKRRQPLDETQIEAAVTMQIDDAEESFLALGTDFDSRVVVVTRFGKIRYVRTVADDDADTPNAISALAKDGFVCRCEPVALVHAHWQADIFGPDSILEFAVEVCRPDYLAMRLSRAEGFRYEGEGIYSPTSEANFEMSAWFEQNDDVPVDGFGDVWPWTLGPALESVFGASRR